MMNLTGKQLMGIAGAVLSALVTASAQLTDVFGEGVAKDIISVASLVNLVLQSITVALNSQGSIVRDVAAMPGVDAIKVNSQANQTLAQVAVDSSQSKVQAIPEASAMVKVIAQGG